MGDHDSLFKRTFSVPAHAAGELRSVLPPALTSKIDLESLELVPSSFVDPHLSHRHADLLFTASIGGRPACVYFLFEHQSEPDPLMPWRVLEYMNRIWAAALRSDPTRTMLPAIVTVVVHHGAQGWTAPRSFHEVVDGLDAAPELRTFVPDFELAIDDLATADDTELHRRPLAAFPKVTLWLLRDIRTLHAIRDHLAAWADELSRLVLDDPARDDCEAVLSYIRRVLGDESYEEFRELVIEVAPIFGEAMPTVEQLIEKAREEARAEAREEARAEARGEFAREMLARVLRNRFGTVDPQTERRIAEGSMAEVERWVEQAMVAARIEDVFDE